MCCQAVLVNATTYEWLVLSTCTKQFWLRSFAMPFLLGNVILLTGLIVFPGGMCHATCVTLKDEAQTEDVSFLAHVRGWLPQGEVSH